MGIPLDIYSLYRLEGAGAGCLHHLLLRVGQPPFSNADEGDYERAAEAAERKRGALLKLFEAEVLAAACGSKHSVIPAGELQSPPAGDELSGRRGGFYVELWVAETRFGRPWVVLGTAPGEEEFWRAVAEDEDLSGLGARRPARKLRAYFLAEEGDSNGRVS